MRESQLTGVTLSAHFILTTAELQRPGVKDLRVRREVLQVASDDGEAVALGGGHEQRVHHRQGLPVDAFAEDDVDCIGRRCVPPHLSGLPYRAFTLLRRAGYGVRFVPS